MRNKEGVPEEDVDEMIAGRMLEVREAIRIKTLRESQNAARRASHQLSICQVVFN